MSGRFCTVLQISGGLAGAAPVPIFKYFALFNGNSRQACMPALQISRGVGGGGCSPPPPFANTVLVSHKLLFCVPEKREEFSRSACVPGSAAPPPPIANAMLVSRVLQISF